MVHHLVDFFLCRPERPEAHPFAGRKFRQPGFFVEGFDRPPRFTRIWSFAVRSGPRSDCVTFVFHDRSPLISSFMLGKRIARSLSTMSTQLVLMLRSSSLTRYSVSVSAFASQYFSTICRAATPLPASLELHRFSYCSRTCSLLVFISCIYF